MTERLPYPAANRWLKVPDIAPAAIGRAFAYLAAPAAIVEGGATACIFLVAAWGAVAFARGAQVPRHLDSVAVVFAAWFFTLVVINALGGASLSDRYPIAATSYLILLVFPFFVIGMQAVRAEFHIFETLITLTVLFAAGLFVLQVLAFGKPIPADLPARTLYVSGYGLATLSLFVFSCALRTSRVDPGKAAVAVAGLIAVVLAGPRIVWLCAAAGYAIVFLVWALSERRWVALGAVTIVAAPLVWVLSRTSFLRQRIGELAAEFQGLLTTGSTEGVVGIRYNEISLGWRAFLNQPLLGHGIAWIHNDYVAHLVAFGIFGPLFIICFFAVFLFTARCSKDPAMRRFGTGAAIVLLLYMTAAMLLGVPAQYGVIYLCLGLFFLTMPEQSAAETPAGARRERPAGNSP